MHVIFVIIRQEKKRLVQDNKMSIHEGNYYMCDQCGHEATLNSSLKETEIFFHQNTKSAFLMTQP